MLRTKRRMEFFPGHKFPPLYRISISLGFIIISNIDIVKALPQKKEREQTNRYACFLPLCIILFFSYNSNDTVICLRFQ